jgi:hypothetical protein
MTMTLKGGNIKSGQAAKDVFERELKPGEVGRLMVKVLRANTPKVTGRLRLNWRVYERPVWHQNTMTIRIENEAPYSYRVNVRGKSRGYVERGSGSGPHGGRKRSAHQPGAGRQRALGWGYETMKPILVIDGKPRLYDGPIRYIEWTDSHEPVAGTYAFVVTRDGSPMSLLMANARCAPRGGPCLSTGRAPGEQSPLGHHKPGAVGACVRVQHQLHLHVGGGACAHTLQAERLPLRDLPG